MGIEITKAGSFEEFTGTCKSVERVDDNLQQGREQIKITIETPDTKKGRMFTWIRFPDTATDSSLPEDSNMTKYYQDIKILDKEVKAADTVFEAFKALEGKKFRWVKKQYGKTYKGHEPTDYWVPAEKVK